jgi:hypothetical protein
MKRPVASGSLWPLADIRQPEKSLSPYRPFRFLNFQRCHRQQPTPSGQSRFSKPASQPNPDSVLEGYKAAIGNLTQSANYCRIDF